MFACLLSRFPAALAFSLLQVVAFWFVAAATAAETRGLKVFAIDRATQQTAEVQLYRKSIAVIIGIDQYQNLPPDRQLAYAVRDAKGMEDVLRRNFKFDRVLTLYNQQATRERILDLLTEELPGQMGKEDALFVFWAGHGNQEKSDEGELGYLIPYDGNPRKIRTNITMAEIRDTVSKKIPAKHVFYVMDACYSGLLTETRAVDKGARRDLAYLQDITRERVRQVLTAGSKDQEVLDGGRNGHSVFTGRLIELLENAGDFITANEIQAAIKEKVFGDARARNHVQTPGYGTLYGSGDFVFVPSIEQKVAENRSEIERVEKDLKALEDRALASASARQLEELVAARAQVEVKLRAEQVKQQQLQEDKRRRDAAEAERLRLVSVKAADDKRLAEVRADLEKRRQQGSGGAGISALDDALAEIRRLEVLIAETESGADKSLADVRAGVLARYAERQRAIEAQKRDEFETEQKFRERIARDQADNGRLRDEEVARLKGGKIAEAETGPLRARIRKLEEEDYLVPAAQVSLELLSYNPEVRHFLVRIRSRNQNLDFFLEASVPMPPETARGWRQAEATGLLAVELAARPLGGKGKVTRISLSNAVDATRLFFDKGEFIAAAELERRQKQRGMLSSLQTRLGLQLVDVPAGCFDMGSNIRDAEEGPAHRVCLGSFQMGASEVTQRQWTALMGKNPSKFVDCGEACPVENVSWDDAQEFIRKLNAAGGGGFRLPSEAEWEYACRAGTTFSFCGSDNPSAVAWFAGDVTNRTDIRKTGNVSHLAASSTRKEKSRRTARDDYASAGVLADGPRSGSPEPVAAKAANAFGLFDMSGNVMEWVADCWHDGYRNAPVDGSAWAEEKCTRRVLRGGSMFFAKDYARAGKRMWLAPTTRDFNNGLRIARSYSER